MSSDLFRQHLYGVVGETALVYQDGEARHAGTLEESSHTFCEGHYTRRLLDEGLIRMDGR